MEDRMPSDNGEDSKHSRQSELKEAVLQPQLKETRSAEEGSADDRPEPAITPRVCLKCHDLISDATHTCAQIPTIATLPRTARRIPPGTVIGGDYEIIEFVGEGGMSTVYKARHLLMNRIVAVKLLHQHLLCDENTVRRFQREAQAAGNLDDPHIIKVHDFGVETDAQPFLVMDFVVGISLAELVAKDEPLPLSRSMGIFRQVCEGLSKAHSKGIVHRDLKPSNIMMIDTPDGSDFVKLLDFGIAKILPSEGNEHLHLTQTGEVFGSPLYMSPEQCMAKELDTRADIYAMGCLIYEAIAGKPPLVGANVFETFYKQTHDMPAPLASVRPDLKESEALDAIVLKCMAKKPEDRYQHVNELKEALDLISVQEAGGLVGKLKRQLELNRIKRGARKGTPLDTRVVGFVTVLLLLAVAATAVVSFRRGQITTTDQSSGRLEQQWSKLDRQGQKLFDSGDLNGAFALFSQARQMAQETNRPKLEKASIEELIDIERARGNDSIAADLQQKQRAKTRQAELDGFKSLEQELDQLLKDNPGIVSDPDTRKNIEKAYHRANDTVIGYVDNGNIEEPRKILKKALALARQTLGEDFKAMGRAFHNLGYIEHIEGNYAAAISHYKQALEKERKFLPPTDALTARTLVVLGRAYMQTEDSLVKGEEPLLEAIDINRRNFGGGSPQAAWVKMNLAQLYTKHGRFKEAMQEIQSAIAILESTEDNGQNVETNHRLAQAYVLKSQLTQSPQDFARALDLLEEMVDKDYQYMSVALLGRADQTFASAPRKDEKAYKRALNDAYSLFLRLSVISDRLPTKERQFNELYAMERMASICRCLLDMKRADELLTDAIAESTMQYGANSIVTAELQGELAAVYMDSGRINEAEALLEKAMPILEKLTDRNDSVSKTQQRVLYRSNNLVGDMVSRYSLILEKNGRKSDASKLKETWRKAGWNL